MNTTKATKYSPTEQQRHINNLVFATMSTYPRYFALFTSMFLAGKIDEAYGIKVDWHACALALDDLCMQEKVWRSGTTPTGLATYGVL